jgi:hypothetical protein
MSEIYRYVFRAHVCLEDVECTLLLALWGIESIHGESQVCLDAGHYFDPEKRACVIDASTPVGRDLNRLYVGFLRRELNQEDFRVERVERLDSARPTPSQEVHS